MVPAEAEAEPSKPQQGVFGGPDAVRAMFFGWGCSETDDEQDCHGWSADDEDTAFSTHPCGMNADEADSCDAAVPRKHRDSSADRSQESDEQSMPEVQEDVDCLVMDSLDALLFCEDDCLFTQCCERTFSVPLSDVHAMSERSSSLGSCRSMEDDCDGAGGFVSVDRAELRKNVDGKAAAPPAEHRSPTSHLPEQPFTSALFHHLQNAQHSSSFSYLHAEMWAAMHLHGTACLKEPSHPKAAASPLLRPPSGADGCQGQHALHGHSAMDLSTWQGHTLCQ